MSASSAYAILVVAAGAAANLLFAAMFTARVAAPGWAHPLGLTGTAMAIPLLAAAMIALVASAAAWDVTLPLVFVAFAVLEVVVDDWLHLNVRETAWLWPYLAAFYLAQWAVIGAAFRATRLGGAAVLVTYFICLAATAYSYRAVGHGLG